MAFFTGVVHCENLKILVRYQNSTLPSFLLLPPHVCVRACVRKLYKSVLSVEVSEFFFQTIVGKGDNDTNPHYCFQLHFQLDDCYAL